MMPTAGTRAGVRRYPVAATLGEAPMWCTQTRRLWFVDIRGPALYRLDPLSGTMERTAFGELLGMVVLGRDGLVIGQGRQVLRYDPATGATDLVAELPAPHPAVRINDTKVGPDGSLWCGTMRDGGGAPDGSLYRIRPDGTVATVLSGISVPNALAFSPDGSYVYFTDTRKGTILRGDARADDPAFTPFAAPDIAPGHPDGATVDAEGCLWVTRHGAGAIARIDPAGRLDRLVELPATQPTSCAFGGDDLRILFVTTARQRMSPEALAAEPAAGDVLALDVGVAGLPEPRFDA